MCTFLVTQEMELRLLVAVAMKQFLNLLDTLTCGDSFTIHSLLICRELFTQIKGQIWENVNISLCSGYLGQKLIYNFPSSQGFPCREKINSNKIMLHRKSCACHFIIAELVSQGAPLVPPMSCLLPSLSPAPGF